jgi:hypothetical protein
MIGVISRSEIVSAYVACPWRYAASSRSAIDGIESSLARMRFGGLLSGAFAFNESAQFRAIPIAAINSRCALSVATTPSPTSRALTSARASARAPSASEALSSLFCNASTSVCSSVIAFRAMISGTTRTMAMMARPTTSLARKVMCNAAPFG